MITVREARRLEAIHDILAAVPAPAACGSQSRTITGIMTYAQDMEAITPWVKRAMRAVVLTSRKVEEEDPDLLIETMRGWVRARVKADWKLPIPDVERFAPVPSGDA